MKYRVSESVCSRARSRLFRKRQKKHAPFRVFALSFVHTYPEIGTRNVRFICLCVVVVLSAPLTIERVCLSVVTRVVVRYADGYRRTELVDRALCRAQQPEHRNGFFF